MTSDLLGRLKKFKPSARIFHVRIGMTEGHAPAEAKSLPSSECPAVSLVPLVSGSLGQTVQRQLNLSIMPDLGSNLSDPGRACPSSGSPGTVCSVWALTPYRPLWPSLQLPCGWWASLCCHPSTLGSSHNSHRLPLPQLCQHLISTVSSQSSSLPCLDHSRGLWFFPSPSLLSLFSDLLQRHIPP